MANGTINLVNNSTALTGVGSNFLTEVTPGDFIYAEVGTVPYTLPVDKVNSDTSITLLRKFIGPTTSGLVWVLIPRRAQNAVYSKLADQVSQALLQALTNEDNWQKLLTQNGQVSIVRPDGSTYTGPSWISVVSGFDRLKQLAASTNLNFPSGKAALVLRDSDKAWGVYDDDLPGWRPLGIGQGGTGKATADEARRALNAFQFKASSLNTSLNNYVGDNPGVFYAAANDYASTANGFPFQLAGSVCTFTNGANGGKGCTQIYMPYTGANGIFFRRYLAANNTWEAGGVNGWKQLLSNNGDVVGGSTPTINDFNNITQNNIAFGYGTGVNSPAGLTGVINCYSNSKFGEYKIQIFNSYTTSRMFFRAYNADSIKAWTAWAEVYSTLNTTRTSDGNLKAASPIVKLFADGSFETNDESEGATVTRLDVGQYLIEGCEALNSDAAWGGWDGGFDIPTDRNKQPLIWLDYDVNPDGSVLVKTYHRTHPDSPEFARNRIGYKNDAGDFIETVANGDPVDIPSDQFVSVRVEMPQDSIWNMRQRELEEAMEAERAAADEAAAEENKPAEGPDKTIK